MRMRRKVPIALLSTMLLVGVLITTVEAAQATFHGKNGKIAFAGNATGNYEIYSINPDGTGLTNLTNNPASDVLPAWSPDGTKIAFSSRFRPGDTSREIYVMNADGSGQQRLTNNAAFDSVPSWSPDGSKIIFTSGRDGNAEIYVMNADGSNQTRLTDHTGGDFSARYHPGESKILFDRSADDGTFGPIALYTMKPDGTNIRKLTDDSLQAGFPDWSPSPGRIVFVDNSCGDCPASDVFVMNPSGGNIRQLTDNFGNNLFPHYSPDGRKITFTHEDGPPFSFDDEDIYTMNADGTGRVNLTNTPTADEFGSDWQPV